MTTTATPPLDHECWWKDLAQGLAGTLADLDSDSALSALRQMLRGEHQRRKAAVEAVERVHATLARYQQHDRNAMVNAQQIKDLLDPEGMWSYSYVSE